MTKIFFKLLLFKVLILTAGVHASLRESSVPDSPQLAQMYPQFSNLTTDQAYEELQFLVSSGEVAPDDIRLALSMVRDFKIDRTTTVRQVKVLLKTSGYFASAVATAGDAALGRAPSTFHPKVLALAVFALHPASADCASSSVADPATGRSLRDSATCR